MLLLQVNLELEILMAFISVYIVVELPIGDRKTRLIFRSSALKPRHFEEENNPLRRNFLPTTYEERPKPLGTQNGQPCKDRRIRRIVRCDVKNSRIHLHQHILFVWRNAVEDEAVILGTQACYEPAP